MNNLQDPIFPKNYPCSVLLGCVEVVDVLSNDEYRKQTPIEDREENGSDYLFICKNARMLVFPLPVSGQHKIC